MDSRDLENNLLELVTQFDMQLDQARGTLEKLQREKQKFDNGEYLIAGHPDNGPRIRSFLGKLESTINFADPLLATIAKRVKQP